MSRTAAGSISSSSTSRRTSLDSMMDDQLFPLELRVMIKGLAPTSNPIVGMFGMDTVSGALNFLSHTELQRSTGHPKFDKKLQLNYYPGRNQKIQFNVYSAPWRDDAQDNDICEEDRVGSVIVSLDKIPQLQSRLNFTPVKVELPLWHDTDIKLHQALQKQGTAIMIEFLAQEGLSTGPLSGPKSEMTYLESIQMMTTGANFLKYRFSSSGKPQQRFVFYDKYDGPMGTIYWCDVGKRKKEKDKNIPLHTVTGLFEENQTKAFKKFFKKPDPRQLERCFSIVAKDRTLDLEAQSKAQRDAFMYGIHKVLTSQGFDIKEQEKGEAERAKLEESKRPAYQVRNTFEITSKLRNLPIMPWANDDTNKTLVAVYEKQGPSFVLIDQTDWQNDNAQPNFTKPLHMPFTVPLTPAIVKVVIYDHSFDDSHVLGSALLRTDTFQRFVGQEMLIKLRNHGDAQLDAALTENNTYMLLTAVIRQGDVREQALAATDPQARQAMNSVLGQLKGELGGGSGGGGGGSGAGGKGKGGGYKNTFIKSITTFLSSGESFTLHPVNKAAVSSPPLPDSLAAIKKPTKTHVFYRSEKHSSSPSSSTSSSPSTASVSPTTSPNLHGHLYFVDTGDKHEDDLLDEHGHPVNPFLILPMTQLHEILTGIHPPHFKNKPADIKAERCMTLMIKEPTTTTKVIYSLDLEARNKALRDAWSSGLGDFISYLEESTEGGDDEKLKFLEDANAPGKAHTALDAAKKNKLQGDSNIMGEASGRFSLGGGDQRLKKGKWDDEAEEEDEEEQGQVGKAKIELEAPVLGEGDIPAPPPMFDVVFGADGVPLAPDAPPIAPGFTVAAPAYTGPKLKRLHWEALDGINVDGTLWGLVQGDLEAEAGAMLEEMFKIADAKKKSVEEEESKEKFVKLYDSKRSQNILILLKSFRMPVEAIQNAIITMDMTILTQERLQILLTCCPTIEETQMLKQYQKKDPELLHVAQAEKFGYALLDIPKVTMRLRLLLFQTKFDGIVKDMIDQYTTLYTGAVALHNSEKLKKVMQVVLGVGNYLNQSTRRKAVGFRLQALEKLNDTKSTDNKQTLLDFIIDYMEKVKAKEAIEEPELVKHPNAEESMEEESQAESRSRTDTPPSYSSTTSTTTSTNGEKQPPPSYLAELSVPVHEAAQIDWKALNEERENLLTGLHELDKELQSMSANDISENDQFKVVMEEFLAHAHKRVLKLKKKYSDVTEESTALIEYFGENSKSMETTELFKIFDRFFTMYKAAEINAFNRHEAEARKEKLAKQKEDQQKQKEEQQRLKEEREREEVEKAAEKAQKAAAVVNASTRKNSSSTPVKNAVTTSSAGSASTSQASSPRSSNTATSNTTTSTFPQANENKEDGVISASSAASAFGVTLRKRPSLSNPATATNSAPTAEKKAEDEQQVVTDAIAGKTKYVPTTTNAQPASKPTTPPRPGTNPATTSAPTTKDVTSPDVVSTSAYKTPKIPARPAQAEDQQHNEADRTAATATTSHFGYKPATPARPGTNTSTTSVSNSASTTVSLPKLNTDLGSPPIISKSVYKAPKMPLRSPE